MRVLSAVLAAAVVSIALTGCCKSFMRGFPSGPGPRPLIDIGCGPYEDDPVSTGYNQSPGSANEDATGVLDHRTDYGFKIELPDRWKLDHDHVGYDGREFGGSFQAIFRDSEGRASFLFIATRAQSHHPQDIESWVRENVMRGPESLLGWYARQRDSSQRDYGDPSEQLDVLPVGTGQSARLIVLAPLQIGEARPFISFAYLPSTDGKWWYCLFVFNEEEIGNISQDVSTILTGIAIL